MTLALSAVPAEWALAQDETENAGEFCLKVPIVDTSFCLPESYRPWVLALVAFLVLIYYVPRGVASIRATLAQTASTRALFELEKMKYEILKLRYEIEGLRKHHKIEELDLPPELEQRIRKAERRAEAEAKQPEPGDDDAFIRQQLQPDAVPKPYAGRRMLAFMFDFVVFSLGFNLVLGFLSEIFGVDVLGAALENIAIVYVSQLLVGVAYFVGMPAAFGATLGKMLVGLRIVSSDGAPITPWQALLRFLLWLLSNFFLGFGFFWALWDPRKLSLYDKATGTRVVYTRGAASA